MTFIELVEEVAVLTGMKKKDVKKVIKQTFATIEEQVLDHKRDVAIIDFGRFKKRTVKAVSKSGKRKFSFGAKVTPRDTITLVSYCRKVREDLVPEAEKSDPLGTLDRALKVG
jgi:nucleoid DNA-binding protein